MKKRMHAKPLFLIGIALLSVIAPLEVKATALILQEEHLRRLKIEQDPRIKNARAQQEAYLSRPGPKPIQVQNNCPLGVPNNPPSCLEDVYIFNPKAPSQSIKNERK